MFHLIREVLLPLQKMLPYFLISSSFEKAPHLGSLNSNGVRCLELKAHKRNPV